MVAEVTSSESPVARWPRTRRSRPSSVTGITHSRETVGPAFHAEINNPRGVAVAADGSVYVVDTATSIGENPSFGFAFRATEAGTLKVTFFDTHGARFEGIASVKLA